MPKKIATPLPTTGHKGPAGDSVSAVKAAATEPTPLDAIIEPATAEDAIQALISALDLDPKDVSALEISQYRVRILGHDRSMRTRKVDWMPKEEDADASE